MPNIRTTHIIKTREINNIKGNKMIIVIQDHHAGSRTINQYLAKFMIFDKMFPK
jgi:hypothetical protein